MRISSSGLKVLKAFMGNTAKSLHGYELMQQANISSGTLYPLLMRFEEHGLLRSQWETAEPDPTGRPRRRLYTITGEGQRVALERLNNFGERAAA